MSPKKEFDPVDVHIGSRIRMYRKQLGLSQETVGEHLGVSYQQVQKYEKGENRIRAADLLKLAKFMHISITEFFKGMPGA